MAPTRSRDNLAMLRFLYGGMLEISGSLSQMRWMNARIIPGPHLPRESVLSFVWDFLVSKPTCITSCPKQDVRTVLNRLTGKLVKGNIYKPLCPLFRPHSQGHTERTKNLLILRSQNELTGCKVPL